MISHWYKDSVYKPNVYTPNITVKDFNNYAECLFIKVNLQHEAINYMHDEYMHDEYMNQCFSITTWIHVGLWLLIQDVYDGPTDAQRYLMYG